MANKVEQKSLDKSNRTINVVIKKASYYRANPHRFVYEFLNINLKIFQKILLWAMMKYDNFFFIACRGLGKTYLVALFSVVRCILYPGTKIVVSSYTFKQGKETVLKITDDFMHKSSLLRNEIKKTSTGINDCGVWFKNGSWIQVRVASENSRGARANVLIVDESRMVSKTIIDKVLSPMLNTPRSPGYLRKPEYEHLTEVGKKLFMTSAWYTASECYEMAKNYTARLLDSKNFFICDLPYQISIQSNLLLRETVENEMSESTFNDISFMMEYEGKFYGSGEDSLFNFKILNGRRIVQESLRNLDFYKEQNITIPKKQGGEKRVLSVDIALLASKKHDNDATAITIGSLVPTPSNNYIVNIVFIETKEGMVTEDLGLLLMRYYYQYDIDYISLDANGVGQPVLDYLMADRYDPIYGQPYGALQCINNDDLNTRCKVKDAPKVIFAIKGNARLNNDMCLSLRAGFQNGNINLLVMENDIEEILKKQIKGYAKLTDNQKAKLKLPYYQTSFLIDELINLEHEVNNNVIKVKEKPGMRKDRYSSIEYLYYAAQQLSLKLKPKRSNVESIVDLMPIKTAKRSSYF